MPNDKQEIIMLEKFKRIKLGHFPTNYL